MFWKIKLMFKSAKTCKNNDILKIMKHFGSWNFDAGVKGCKKVMRAGDDKITINFHALNTRKNEDFECWYIRTHTEEKPSQISCITFAILPFFLRKRLLKLNGHPEYFGTYYGGTWFGQGFAARASKPLPIFMIKGYFGRNGYPLLRIFQVPWKIDHFHQFCDLGGFRNSKARKFGLSQKTGPMFKDFFFLFLNGTHV